MRTKAFGSPTPKSLRAISRSSRFPKVRGRAMPRLANGNSSQDGACSTNCSPLPPRTRPRQLARRSRVIQAAKISDSELVLPHLDLRPSPCRAPPPYPYRGWWWGNRRAPPAPPCPAPPFQVGQHGRRLEINKVRPRRPEAGFTKFQAKGLKP